MKQQRQVEKHKKAVNEHRELSGSGVGSFADNHRAAGRGTKRLPETEEETVDLKVSIWTRHSPKCKMWKPWWTFHSRKCGNPKQQIVDAVAREVVKFVEGFRNLSPRELRSVLSSRSWIYKCPLF